MPLNSPGPELRLKTTTLRVHTRSVAWPLYELTRRGAACQIRCRLAVAVLAERAELATAPSSDGVRLEAPADATAGIKADQWSLPGSAIYPITDGTNAETTNSPPSVRQEWAAPVDAC